MGRSSFFRLVLENPPSRSTPFAESWSFRSDSSSFCSKLKNIKSVILIKTLAADDGYRYSRSGMFVRSLSQRAQTFAIGPDFCTFSG